MVISFPSKIPCLSYHHNYRKLDILSDTNEQQGGAASGTHGRTFSEDGGGDHREGPHTKIIRDAKKRQKTEGERVHHQPRKVLRTTFCRLRGQGKLPVDGGRLAISKALATPIRNRLHCYQHDLRFPGTFGCP